MKPTLLALSLAALAFAGCDKHQSSTDRAAAPTAAAAVAPKAAEADKTATAPAAAKAEGEGMSCGNEKMAEGEASCGDMAKGEGEAGGGCSQWDEAAAEVAKKSTPADAVWATIPVKGMTCGGCERRIVANLGKVDGILGVEADSELGQVRVAFAKGNDKIATDARTHIASLGYQPQ